MNFLNALILIIVSPYIKLYKTIIKTMAIRT